MVPDRDPVRDWMALQGWQVDTRQGPALRWSAWRGETLVLARHDGWVVRIEDGADLVQRHVRHGRFVGAAIEAVEAAWKVLATGGPS